MFLWDQGQAKQKFQNIATGWNSKQGVCLIYIHGVAWISKDELADRQITGYLCDHVKETEALARELISCELPDSDDELRSIVSEVQKHGHTKLVENTQELADLVFHNYQAQKHS